MTAKQKPADRAAAAGPLVVGLVILLLAGLPVAAWLDLRNLSERMLRRQADEIGRIIDDMRGFYASDVVGRVLANARQTVPTANYREHARRHPDPGHAVDRARQAHQRAQTGPSNTASSRTCRSRAASPTTLDAFETRRDRSAAGRSEAAGRRSVRLDLRPPRPHGGPGA